MGLLKSPYKKNQYNNFYIGLDLLPAEEMPLRREVAPYKPVQLPAKEAPTRKVMLGPKIPKVAEDEVKSQDEEMFEKLLITDLLRSGQ